MNLDRREFQLRAASVALSVLVAFLGFALTGFLAALGLIACQRRLDRTP